MRNVYLALLGSSLGALAFQTPTLALDANLDISEFSNISTSGAEFTQVSSFDAYLNCSQEEREDALSRFGCGCTSCVSAVKELRGQAPLRQLMFGEEQQIATHPHDALGNKLAK